QLHFVPSFVATAVPAFTTTARPGRFGLAGGGVFAREGVDGGADVVFSLAADFGGGGVGFALGFAALFGAAAFLVGAAFFDVAVFFAAVVDFLAAPDFVPGFALDFLKIAIKSSSARARGPHPRRAARARARPRRNPTSSGRLRPTGLSGSRCRSPRAIAA